MTLFHNPNSCFFSFDPSCKNIFSMAFTKREQFVLFCICSCFCSIGCSGLNSHQRKSPGIRPCASRSRHNWRSASGSWSCESFNTFFMSPMPARIAHVEVTYEFSPKLTPCISSNNKSVSSHELNVLGKVIWLTTVELHASAENNAPVKGSCVVDIQ